MLFTPALSAPRSAVSVATRELTFTESARPGEHPSQPLNRLAARLREKHAGIIGLMVFGSISSRRLIEAAIQDALGATAWPVLWIEGASCHGAALAGVQAFALAGGMIEPVSVNGRVMASRYTLGDTELCWVGGALPDDTTAEPGLQTTQAFNALERALNAAGFALRDVVRTWCYNHELLKWYDEFNRARSARYRTVAFRTGLLPASTGISAANPAGAALILACLAIRPLNAGCNAHEIGSPLQCPAPAYGSAFSRAVEIDFGTTRRILISGTASIAPGGATVWQNDIHHQVGLTMDVVGAILKSRNLEWRNVTRAIAYFKSPDFVPAFEHWCSKHDWANPPCINLHCDICRDDLLFELELDAESPGPS